MVLFISSDGTRSTKTMLSVDARWNATTLTSLVNQFLFFYGPQFVGLILNSAGPFQVYCPAIDAANHYNVAPNTATNNGVAWSMTLVAGVPGWY